MSAAASEGRQQQQQQEGAAGAAPAKRKPVFVKVDQLKPGTSGHTLTVNVVNSKTVLQKGRAAPAQQRQTRIAECLVGDETGSIVFTARNDQEHLIALVDGTARPVWLPFKEWILASRIDVADKLGIWLQGRAIVFPQPSSGSKTSPVFDVGSVVDAWWNDGW